MALLFSSVRQYRSSLYETARGVLRSRNNLARRGEELFNSNRQLRQENQRLARELRQAEQRHAQAEQRLAQQQRENEAQRKQPIRWPSDLPLRHHSYGPKMIALCLNLAKQIGFRPAESALTTIFQWLEIQAKVPSSDAIRLWMMRVGIAELAAPVEAGDDWIWMADHSNQIGPEKVLQIVGIRASQLPPPGETLKLAALRVLAVVPGKQWKREDVRREYEQLAERMGPPRYLLTDGAVELRESANVLEKPRKKLTVLRDIKHFAANALEKLIGKSARFTAYLAQLGRTRSAIQQTELSHFTPPPQKPKARFMNFGPTLRWGQMAWYHLQAENTRARAGVSAARMREKLGWLADFAADLAGWNRCQEVLQACLKFCNEQGLYRGSAGKLKVKLREITRGHSQPCELSSQLATQLVAFVKRSAADLGKRERAWLSTENLESSFGLFKKLEGQHSKGGFTSLVAAMPALLTQWTPDLVRERLSAVSVKCLRQWLHDNLGQTLSSKRALAYQEFTAAPAGSS